MDILTDKSLRNYDKLSRYLETPFYYHLADNKYIMGTTKRLKTTTTYTLHTIKQGDTFDSLALLYYNVPTYYWIIADFNRIPDAFTKLPVGYKIRIPNLTTIEFED